MDTLAIADVALLSSLFVSAMLLIGLFGCWLISRDISGRRYNYLLAYVSYLLFVNIPLLLTDLVGMPQHNRPVIILDLLGIVILFWSAEAWNMRDMPRWHLAILAATLLASFLHNWFESYSLLLITSAGRSFMMLLTAYYVSKFAPKIITIGVLLAFASWVAHNIAFPHAGGTVIYITGVPVKVFIFGMVLVTHHERLHGELYAAARIRKRAIEAIMESGSGGGDATYRTRHPGDGGCAEANGFDRRKSGVGPGVSRLHESNLSPARRA